VPTIWQFGNTQLGSLSNLHFHDIFVKDAQALPSLFKSYDRVHQISNVTFDNVIVAGQVQSQPQITFDANRFMSLSGDFVTEPMWIDSSGAADPNVQIWNMQQGEPTTSPVTNVMTLDESFLNDPALKLLRRGDFFGDGFASPLIFDPADAALQIWAEPLNPNSTPGRLGDYTAATIPTGYQFAGVDDFTGDGVSGVLLWNASLQQGLILTMQGSDLVVSREIEPSNHSSSWHVAGIGDFDLNGVSDVLLRDADGNLEILYQGPSGVTSVQDLAPSQLRYSATPLFKQNDPTLPPTGEFDSSWKVAGVGAINNYAAILWINDEGEIGITQFLFPSEKPYGTVIATIPGGMQLQGLGDYNGDGSMDMLLHNPSTGEVAFWYMGWMGGNYYQPAPAAGVQISVPWQN
jgi:hypothetical protein